MANRYWIGNGGNINDTAHWSTTTGGAGGASVPTSADNAYFDANSFSLAGQTVAINASFSCLDMDWTGATNSPSLNLSGNALNIFGSLTLISTLSLSGVFSLAFRSTITGKTITTGGANINVGGISFSGVGGGWTLQDNFTTNSNITLTNGSLDTNGKTVTCAGFNGSGANARTLTLGASLINNSSDWTFTTTTNLTLNANTSTIKMTGNTSTFDGGGLTYNNVTFSGTPITIIGSNTFNILTFTAGKTVKLTSGTTQTVTSLIANGTTASPSTLQAVTAGSAATIALPAGRYFIRHTSIKDITITGATAATSIAGTNVSGNTGIIFVTKFEIGRIKNDGSFNWYSAATGTIVKVSG